MRKTFHLTLITTILATATTTASAGTDTSIATTSHESPSSDALALWWNGKNATGDWFGLRTMLAEDFGLTFSARYYGAYFGVVDGQNGARGFWGQGVNFGATHNIGKWLNIKELEGVSFFGNIRWRDNGEWANPMPWVESTSLFQPSPWASGTKFRLLSFGLEASTAKLLPVKDMFTLRAGWLQPQTEFLDQPHSKGFLNNSINSAKGIGGNIPFSSSSSTWGGTLRVKPTEWSYAKGGLFMSYPRMTNMGNHGVHFQGYKPDPDVNGYWAMGEFGITPAICSLPGKYALGGYYYGSEHKTYTRGATRWAQYGLYFQADQMLYTPETPDKGKKPTKGLSTFNVFTFAPEEDNLFPFYFHTGLCYEGLIPTRDTDQLLFGLAYGSYSNDKHTADRRRNRQLATYSMVMEASYKANVNKWLHVQPFVQYIVRPNGTEHVKNATIIGFQTGLTF